MQSGKDSGDGQQVALARAAGLSLLTEHHDGHAVAAVAAKRAPARAHFAGPVGRGAPPAPR